MEKLGNAVSPSAREILYFQPTFFDKGYCILCYFHRIFLDFGKVFSDVVFGVFVGFPVKIFILQKPFVVDIFYKFLCRLVERLAQIYPLVIIQTIIYEVYESLRYLFVSAYLVQHLVYGFYQVWFGLNFQIKILRQSQLVGKRTHQFRIKSIYRTDVQHGVVVQNIVQNRLGTAVQLIDRDIFALLAEFFLYVQQFLALGIVFSCEFSQPLEYSLFHLIGSLIGKSKGNDMPNSIWLAGIFQTKH